MIMQIIITMLYIYLIEKNLQYILNIHITEIITILMIV